MTNIIVSISDIHFGALDPLYMYNNLKQQFIQRLVPLNFDILAICGDIFHAKYMSNNPIISYALSFMDDVVNLCRNKQASLIIIDGTYSHDNGQLKLFYHYLNDPSIEFYIVEDIQFIQTKGLRILCIPERYGIPEDYYKSILYDSGMYDMCFMHGTFKGSFHGTEIATLNSSKAPIFSIDAFKNCIGPIIMGHYHISSCYENYAYYNGSPFRWQFGEEQPKGFLVTAYDNRTRRHCTELIPIESYKYITININDIINNDPKTIIEYIKNQKTVNNIDYIRIQYNTSNDNINIVRTYFRNQNNVVFQELERKSNQLIEINSELNKIENKYSYITDPNIDDYHKFVQYINQQENCQFITVDELVSILEREV